MEINWLHAGVGFAGGLTTATVIILPIIAYLNNKATGHASLVASKPQLPKEYLELCQQAFSLAQCAYKNSKLVQAEHDAEINLERSDKVYGLTKSNDKIVTGNDQSFVTYKELVETRNEEEKYKADYSKEERDAIDYAINKNLAKEFNRLYFGIKD